MNSPNSVPAQMLLLYELKHLLVIHPDKRLQIIRPAHLGLPHSIWIARTTLVPSILSPRSFGSGAVFCEYNRCLEERPGTCCTTNELLEHLDKAAPSLPSDDSAVIFCGLGNQDVPYGIGAFTAELSSFTLSLLPLTTPSFDRL